jgi:hypothetical protein
MTGDRWILHDRDDQTVGFPVRHFEENPGDRPWIVVIECTGGDTIRRQLQPGDVLTTNRADGSWSRVTVSDNGWDMVQGGTSFYEGEGPALRRRDVGFV